MTAARKPVTKRKPGRPSKLDDDRAKRILDALREGSYRTPAILSAGVAERTFYRWMSDGERDEDNGKTTPYATFRQQVIRAEAEAEVAAVAHLRKAMPDDWRAAEAYLRMRSPERWAQHRDLTKIAERQLQLAERTAERISLAAEDALATLALTPTDRTRFVIAFGQALERIEETPQLIEGTTSD